MATPTTISIDAASTNLSAVASAITASDAGVTAQVLDTGSDNDDTDRYRLVLSGPLGADNAFSVSTTLADPTELAFSTPAGQTASDASLTINGITVSRTSNTIDDVITGVTFDLQTTTSSAATVLVSQDGTGLKTKIE